MSREARKALLLVALADLLRLAGAIPLGLGDAEALYANYALHVQGGYLDHPPLIGWLDRLVLMAWPSAFALRLMAVSLFTLSAWLLFRLARTLFDDRAAWYAVAILCIAPVFHLGGLAAAPDAPLAPLWIWWLAGAWAVWRNGATTWPRTLAWAAVLGLLLGEAFLAKYSALALIPVALVVAWRLGGARRWAAIAVGAACASAAALPVIVWNARHGWASVMHRLVWSQDGAGPSFRNLGALVGGQLLYLSPLVAIGLAWAVVRAWRERTDPAVRFSLVASLLPFAVLAPVCLWSRAAEPHWPLPAYFALLPLAGRLAAGATGRARRFVRAAAIVAVAMDALVYVAVLTPVLPRWVPEPVYVAKYDIANELYGWSDVAAAVRRRLPPCGIVVAGHYTMCAQLAWNVDAFRVACRTRLPTDFDFWPPEGPDWWKPMGRTTFDVPVLFVSDERFPDRPPGPGGAAAPSPVETVMVERGGVPVRRFVLTSYAAGTVSLRP